MEAEEIRTQNIKKLIEEYGYPKLIALTGKSQSQLSQWATNAKNSRTKKPSNISRGSCRAIEKTLKLPTGWMDQDHSEASGGETTCVPTFTRKPDETIFDVLDVKAACGNGIVNIDHPEIIRRLIMPTEKALELIGSTNRNGQIRVIVAAKDSMFPTIKPNDLLFVDISIKDFKGEAIYILLHGEELICKRLQLLGKNLTVTSDNKNYDSWHWEDRPDETQIVGKVLRALPLDFKIFGG